MYRSKEEIEKEIDACIVELRKIAMEDHQITSEERAILEKIEEDFRHMQTQIMQVLESELDKEEFDDLVNDFLHDIVVNAIKVAKEDGVISGDEQKLLNKIKEFVKKGGRL